MRAKRPISKLAISFYIIGFCWLLTGYYAFDAYSTLPGVGPSHQSGVAVSALLPSILGALLTILLAPVVQMISDIRWKLFESDKDA